MKIESDYVRRTIANGKGSFERELRQKEYWQNLPEEERERIKKEQKEMDLRFAKEFPDMNIKFVTPDDEPEIDLQQKKESFVKEIVGNNADVNSDSMIFTETAPALINELLGNSPTPYQVLVASHLLNSIKNIWVLGRLKQGAWTLKQLKDKFSVKDFKELKKFVDNQKNKLYRMTHNRAITFDKYELYIKLKGIVKERVEKSIGRKPSLSQVINDVWSKDNDFSHEWNSPEALRKFYNRCKNNEESLMEKFNY